MDWVIVLMNSFAWTVENLHCKTWQLSCSFLKVLPKAPYQLQKIMVLELLVEDKGLKRLFFFCQDLPFSTNPLAVHTAWSRAL
jgi:hypothetical protein